jgi:hypothetical protein
MRQPLIFPSRKFIACIVLLVKCEKSIPKAATLENFATSADLTGPIRQSTMGGAKYLLTFTDQYSKYRWGFLLKIREMPGIIEAYRKVTAVISNLWNRKVSADGEFNKKVFTNILEIDGTFGEYTRVRVRVNKRLVMVCPNEASYLYSI